MLLPFGTHTESKLHSLSPNFLDTRRVLVMGSFPTPHIVVVPFAQQGHINPLMQLARKLASHGAIVSFVVSENTVPSGSKASSIPNLTFLGVPDNLPPERSRGSSFRDSVDSMVNMEAGFRELLHRLHRMEERTVSTVIYDCFMTWVPAISTEIGIPCVSFFTSNATTCALIYQVPALLKCGVLPFRREGKDTLPDHTINNIAGVPEILPEEFPMCLTFDETHFRYKFVVGIALTMHKASGIIVNAIEDMEPEAVAAMKAHIPFYPVGPLLLLSGQSTQLDVNYWQEQDHCLTWLDGQPSASVLYVSFGSVASLPTSHFQQLALGLQESKQRFLWVIRPDSIDVPLEEALPDGFAECTKEQGMIISWGPQLKVLSHPSVGGFLTHGGWNSIVENLVMGSVPMICWPHAAEQRLNRRLMKDYWKIGMRFEHEADGGVRKEEVARVVRELMEGEHGAELRKASAKLGDMAQKAVTSGGLSIGNFEALYHQLLLDMAGGPQANGQG